ncbi:MAG: hypothetical protein K8L97_05810 [Anaerolineae bacterium]|nr:hypothetical protein [Anaerolineae bacterium]
MDKPQFTKLKKLLPIPPATSVNPAPPLPPPAPGSGETLPYTRKTAANWQKKLKTNG